MTPPLCQGGNHLKPIPQKYKGILLIITSAFCFALMNAFVRMSGALPATQKSFFRNLVALGIAAVTFAPKAKDFKMPQGTALPLFLRASFGTVGILCNFWAISHMILADANMLNKLSPFFAIIMSVFILKEIPSRFEWSLVVLAFIGALFVIKPTSGIASLPALVGVMGGFGAGTAYTFVRKISQKGERGPVIVMFFSTFSCLVCLPFVLIDFHPMTLQQTLILLGAGLAAAGGQLSVTAAYRYAPAKEISIFDYSQILWAALLGFFIFGTTPDLLSVIGYVIILFAALLRWYHTRKQ
jgi:drug/metabolite transporter (DMT)-like permease